MAEETIYTERFGPMLRRLRCTKKGPRSLNSRDGCTVSQDDLSIQSGVSRPTINRYEREIATSPQPHQVNALANALALHGKVRRDFFKSANQPYVPPLHDLPEGMERIMELFLRVDEGTQQRLILHINRFAGALEEKYGDQAEECSVQAQPVSIIAER